MFPNSAAILVRSSFDVVRMILESSRSSFIDRVDRLDDPMKVAHGFCGIEDPLGPAGDSQMPAGECGKISLRKHLVVPYRSLTNLWHDTSIPLASTHLAPPHFPNHRTGSPSLDPVSLDPDGTAIPTKYNPLESTSIPQQSQRTRLPTE